MHQVDESKKLEFYYHIGMVKYEAGVMAEKCMVAEGKITMALCLMHTENHAGLLNHLQWVHCGGDVSGPKCGIFGEYKSSGG